MLSVMRGHEEEITDIATHPKEMVGSLSIHICLLSIHPLLTCLSNHPFIHISVHLPIHQSIFVCLCRFVCLYLVTVLLKYGIYQIIMKWRRFSGLLEKVNIDLELVGK